MPIWTVPQPKLHTCVQDLKRWKTARNQPYQTCQRRGGGEREENCHKDVLTIQQQHMACAHTQHRRKVQYVISLKISQRPQLGEQDERRRDRKICYELSILFQACFVAWRIDFLEKTRRIYDPHLNEIQCKKRRSNEDDKRKKRKWIKKKRRNQKREREFEETKTMKRNTSRANQCKLLEISFNNLQCG